MKKFLSFWLLLLAFCVPVAMIAQDAQVEIVVGDSTGSNSYLPSYSFYNYSLTQQIYDADEIGMPGTINSIAFFNTGSEKTRSYTVYMVETDKEQFNGSTDWITVTASDMVFTGSVVMAAGTWTVFQLTNPFEYDGVSNLAVIMDDNTGSYSSGMSCVIFDAPSKALRVYSDGLTWTAEDAIRQVYRLITSIAQKDVANRHTLHWRNHLFQTLQLDIGRCGSDFRFHFLGALCRFQCLGGLLWNRRRRPRICYLDFHFRYILYLQQSQSQCGLQSLRTHRLYG